MTTCRSAGVVTDPVKVQARRKYRHGITSAHITRNRTHEVSNVSDGLESQISICLISCVFGECREFEGKLLMSRCMRRQKVRSQILLPFRLLQCLTGGYEERKEKDKDDVRTTGVWSQLKTYSANRRGISREIQKSKRNII